MHLVEESVARGIVERICEHIDIPSPAWGESHSSHLVRVAFDSTGQRVAVRFATERPERQMPYWRDRAEPLGTPAKHRARRVVSTNGPIGLRSIMGLICLTKTNPFRTINAACDQAIAHGTERLRDVKNLLEAPASGQMTLSFQTEHPIYRNLAEYGRFIENHA